MAFKENALVLKIKKLKHKTMDDPKDKADLDNHANQLNPNNPEYKGD